jgi:hypothetical protein
MRWEASSLVPSSDFQCAVHLFPACVVKNIMQKHRRCCISCPAHSEHRKRSTVRAHPDLMPQTQDIIQPEVHPEFVSAPWCEGIAVLAIFSEVEVEASAQQLQLPSDRMLDTSVPSI